MLSWVALSGLGRDARGRPASADRGGDATLWTRGKTDRAPGIVSGSFPRPGLVNLSVSAGLQRDESICGKPDAWERDSPGALRIACREAGLSFRVGFAECGGNGRGGNRPGGGGSVLLVERTVVSVFLVELEVFEELGDSLIFLATACGSAHLGFGAGGWAGGCGG